jgi:hypothetical protein
MSMNDATVQRTSRIPSITRTRRHPRLQEAVALALIIALMALAWIYCDVEE